MKRSTLVLAFVLTMGVAACEGSEPGPSGSPLREPSATQEPSTGPEGRPRAARAPSVPARPKVYFGELDGWLPEIETAISDLKNVGYWDDLTDHLYRIDLRVRPGRSNVPKDRHLADARFWKATIARGTYDYPEGAFCW